MYEPRSLAPSKLTLLTPLTMSMSLSVIVFVNWHSGTGRTLSLPISMVVVTSPEGLEEKPKKTTCSRSVFPEMIGSHSFSSILLEPGGQGGGGGGEEGGGPSALKHQFLMAGLVFFTGFILDTPHTSWGTSTHSVVETRWGTSLVTWRHTWQTNILKEISQGRNKYYVPFVAPGHTPPRAWQ